MCHIIPFEGYKIIIILKKKFQETEEVDQVGVCMYVDVCVHVCVVYVKVLCLYLCVNVGAPKMNFYIYVCMHECGSQRQPVCHSSGAVYRDSFLLIPGITEWTILDVQETPGNYLSLPFPCWDYKIISPHPAVFT